MGGRVADHQPSTGPERGDVLYAAIAQGPEQSEPVQTEAGLHVHADSRPIKYLIAYST